MTGPKVPTDALRRGFDRLGAGSRSAWRLAVSAWQSATSGQRWSSTVLLGLAILVVAFGLPASDEPPRGSASPAATEVAGPDTAAPPATEDATPAQAPPSATPAPPSSPAQPVGAGPPAPTPPDATGRPSGADRGPTPSIVALVRSGDGELVGPDDAAIAQVFLDEASFDAETIELTEDDGLCAEVLAAGNVVLASMGIPEELRACLLGAGATIVAHDPAGSSPSAGGVGAVVSTRRSRSDSLADLGRWGVMSGALDGRVGIVASAEVEGPVRSGVPGLRGMGVDVRAVTVVPDGPDASTTIANGVLEYSRRGIEVVVFAATAQHQGDWVLKQAVVQPDVEYVVSDLGEGIIEESYPPAFDNARAHTSLRTPWFQRDEGETPAQQQCRERWEEGSESGATGLGNEELARVFMWCQAISMIVGPALARFDGGTASFEATLRERPVASPLTSVLRATPDGGFGPAHDAVLAWDDGCRCWTVERGFSDDARPPSPDG